MKTIITFDFDGTICSVQYIQKLARCLVLDPSNEVHIVTRRYGYVDQNHGDEMTSVFKIAKAVGIKLDNIHFTNRAYKFKKLMELDADMHYDDDMDDIMLIRTNFSKCKAFLVFA